MIELTFFMLSILCCIMGAIWVTAPIQVTHHIPSPTEDDLLLEKYKKEALVEIRKKS